MRWQPASDRNGRFRLDGNEIRRSCSVNERRRWSALIADVPSQNRVPDSGSEAALTRQMQQPIEHAVLIGAGQRISFTEGDGQDSLLDAWPSMQGPCSNICHSVPRRGRDYAACFRARQTLSAGPSAARRRVNDHAANKMAAAAPATKSTRITSAGWLSLGYRSLPMQWLATAPLHRAHFLARSPRERSSEISCDTSGCVHPRLRPRRAVWPQPKLPRCLQCTPAAHQP